MMLKTPLAGAICLVGLAGLGQASFSYARGQLSFESPRELLAGASPQSVGVGDFNGDDAEDLAVANFGAHTVSILLGNGDGTFRPPANFATGTRPYFVAVADLNGDYVQDVAVANEGSNDVSVLLGKGDGSFSTAGRVPAGTRPWALASGDFNGDGLKDLAVANRASNNVSLLMGRGDGSFIPAGSLPAPSGASFVVAADLNRDGAVDLAVTRYGTAPFPSVVSIFLGRGDGTFETPQVFGVGSNPVAIVVSDLNRDTVPDFAVAGFRSDTVSILLGHGDGSFATTENYQVGGFPSSIAIADFDADGLADVATADQHVSVSVLAGRSHGRFHSARYFWAGGDPISLAVGDFNQDGLQDIALANFLTSRVAVLLNDTPQRGDGVRIVNDIVYDDGPGYNPRKHILDVYLPAHGRPSTVLPQRGRFPVVFFVNGGAFRNGAKTRSALFCRTLAREGFVVVAPDYRLTDGSPDAVVHPGHIEDNARAFAWVYRYIKHYGGDRRRIILMGHSAGAHQASLLALDSRYLAVHGLSTDLIRGVIAVSGGAYDLRGEDRLADVFGATAEERWEASPQRYVSEHRAPFLVMVADNDQPAPRAQFRPFYEALLGAGAAVELHEIGDRTHQGIIGRAALTGDPMRELTLAFIDRLVR